MVFKIRRKQLKITGIVTGILLLLLMAMHFWFISHLNKVIEELVRSKSNGKLELSIEKSNFNYLTKRIRLRQVIIYTNDTSQSAMYRFSVNQIEVKATAFWPLVTNQLLIDSISLYSPHVEMTRIKPREKSINADISIPEEIGRVYNSIQQALEVLKVKSFQLNNGRFTLINQLKPQLEPTTISNIYFQIDNLLVDSSRQANKEKILFSDNIVLRTSDQSISFPNGRHRLSFGRFRINIKNKLIEIDSCTISVQDTTSGKIRSAVFIDTLKLSNIDFRALYHQQLIKVDSVYCSNPRINLVLELKGKDSIKTKLPDPGRIIQELTGSMELENLNIRNADLNVTTVIDGASSTFAAEQNDFTLKGLKIDPSTEKGLTVKSFAMAIRNYENFIKDSSYAIRFDSILFIKDNIQLRNFSMISKDGGHRSFLMPLFELSGLSWDEALFNRHFLARRATLHQPVITFTKTQTNKTTRKQSFFELLASIHDIMELEQLNVVDGQISLHLRKGLEIGLLNANLQLKSSMMTGSSKFKGIEKSVEALQFSKGVIKIKDVSAVLNEVEFTGKRQLLKVKKLYMSQRRQNISASVNDLLLDELVVDEVNDRITADGLHWKQAEITIRSNEKIQNENNAPVLFMVKNITGSNTRLNFFSEKAKASIDLNTISLAGLEKESGRMRLSGFQTQGHNLEILGLSSKINVTGFAINHNAFSVLKNFSYSQHKNGDTVRISSPEMLFTANIEKMFNKNLYFDDLTILKPLIYIAFIKADKKKESAEIVLPEAFIKNLRMDAPDITFKSSNGISASILRCPNDSLSENKSFLHVQNLRISGNKKNTISIDKAMIAAGNFNFQNGTGRIIGADSSYFASELHNVNLHPANNNQWNWSAGVAEANMRNLVINTTGKKNGRLLLKTAVLSNLNINETLGQDLKKILQTNPLFIIHHINGSYSNDADEFQWYNATFNQSKNTFSLDSFSYKPAIEKDSFIAKNPFQTSFLTMKTGPILVSGINVKKYLEDSAINIKTIDIHRPEIHSYHDKRPPFNANVFRPLPVDMLKNISFPFSVDTISVHSGKIIYTELNKKTLLEGRIDITRVNALLFPVRNNDFSATDSLTVRAEGYLMDSAWMRLGLRQSYTDSPGGFLMTLRMRPSSLKFLNPALEPLASVRLKSGYLDTLSMRAVGREDLSIGEMKMFYHDLKIKFLKKGSLTKKDALTDLITFIANNFVIKKENRSKTGRVYYPRLKNRSIFNYLVKMTLSGIANSVGARQNRKMVLQYQKELKKHPLPPVIFDE